MQRIFSSLWSTIMKAVDKVKPDIKKRPDDVFTGKKKRLPYAVFLSYQGKNYFGMQFQKEYPTIEGHLLSALHLLGKIDEAEKNNPYSFYFQRAARTDRAVSAVRQACSMQLPKDENFPTNGASQLNQFLPEDIRVVAIKRTTPSFHAQKSCDSRTYSYTLPTFAFADLDALTNSDYRITPEKIAQIDELLSVYVGTHNFFNYTSRKEHSDQSCFRYIMSFKCAEPFLYRDTIRNRDVEFITIYIRGQSFMMHQIRKMIGMVLAVARGMVYKTDIQKSFESQRMDVPRAPGIGLLLERLHYERYDSRFKDTHSSLEDLGEEAESNILKIRNELIVSEILATECETQSMIIWLSTLPLHSFSTTHEIGDESSDELQSSSGFVADTNEDNEPSILDEQEEVNLKTANLSSK